MIHDMIMAAAGASGPAAPSDADFENTVLLLHGDGTNGAQNNTFLDSSTNNFTITRNGNTTQGSFSPFSKPDGRWSNYFNGASYLSLANNAALELNGTSFCIEAWVYLSATGSSQLIVGKRDTNGATSYRISYYLWCKSGGVLEFLTNTNTVTSASGVVPANQWNHVAATCDGTNVSLYVNGTRVVAPTAVTLVTSTSSVYIGNFPVDNPWLTGYVSNVRIVKDAQIYSGASYIVPTVPLTAITNTQLLTCQSNRFVDNSSNAFAITATGSPRVTPFSPFPITTAYDPAVNGGSGYFDGSGDYLTVADNTALDMEASDFTMEAFVYLSTTISGNVTIVSKRASNAVFGGVLITCQGSNAPILRATTNNSSWDLVNSTSSVSMVTGQWNHIAVARSGTSWALWVNGVRGISVTASGTVSNNAAAFGISANADGSEPITANSYLSGVRVVKGTAVYDPTQTTLTVPTAPLTAIANTSLLCNFTNAGIFDNTGFNNLETVGNAQIDTTVKKYGTGAMKFDGTGDYLLINGPNNVGDLAFGTGDFTVECWAYFNSLSGTPSLIDFRPSGTNGAYVFVYANGSSSINLYVSSAIRITGTIALSTSTWYHIALTRSGTSTKLFVNGTQVGSTYTDSTSYLGAVARPIIGANGANLADNLNGYIDDLRITKGIARYTAAFTPPTAALPDIGT